MNGVSERSVGESSVSVSEPGGVHCAMFEPIGMYTNPRRRTGLAGVAANAVMLGIMASSRGSASEAPAPRRKVRRGRAFFVTIIATSSSGTVYFQLYL